MSGMKDKPAVWLNALNEIERLVTDRKDPQGKAGDTDMDCGHDVDAQIAECSNSMERSLPESEIDVIDLVSDEVSRLVLIFIC